MLDRLSTPAFDAGRHAYHTGRDNPHPAGSPEHRQWAEGFKFEEDGEWASDHDPT